MDPPERAPPSSAPLGAQDAHASNDDSQIPQSVVTSAAISLSSVWIKRLTHLSSSGKNDCTPGYENAATALGENLACSMEDYDIPSASPDLSFHKNQQDPNNCSASMTLERSQSVNSAASFTVPLIDSTVETSDDKQQENQATMLSNFSVGIQCPLVVKPMNGFLQLVSMDCHMTPINKKTHPLEDVNRTKAPENDGCKGCNCKKTKCLKLYCDCLEAGEYCTEACACQECFNRHEYEEIVYETRQKIVSRNPLAFVPKVVPCFLELLNEGEDRKHATPIEGRHIRGCNCKKSLCLKNYCECYQAQVGCALGCRCEGCENTFGKKAGRSLLIEIGQYFQKYL